MKQLETQFYEFGDFQLDAAARLFYQRDGTLIQLTPKVFDTLLYLVQNSGKVLTKDELLKAVWTDTIVEENNLNQNISILRRALKESPGENRFIITLPGRGYKFAAAVRQIAKETDSVGETAEFRETAETGETAAQIEPAILINDSGAKPGGQNPRPVIENPANNYRLLTITAIVLCAAIAAVGFYLSGRTNQTNEIAAVVTLKTIAVLPFKSLVAENRNEALELGMADTLINKLSGSEIIVRPLSSIRKYSDLEQDGIAAGRELDVESILDGTVQRWGDRIRISARLVRTSDGKQLWTGQFDEKFTDIFAVQDSISERVAWAIYPQLSAAGKQRLTKRDTTNVEAYQFYLLGRYHSAQLTPPETRRGIEYYQRASELDANYALPHIGLAHAYHSLSLTSDLPTSELLPKSKAAALRALEIDETLSESHAALGQIEFWYEWNWQAAETHYRRAVELDGNSAAALLAYAHLNSNLGRGEQAAAQVKRARELDPLSLITNSLEAQFLFFAGRSDEAVARLEKTLEINPNFWHTHLGLARIYLAKKQYAAAAVAAARARDLSGGNAEASANVCFALAKSGRRAEAESVLAELEKRQTERYVPPYNFAIAHNGLGNREAALEWLERGFGERDPRLVFLKIDPKWNNLRDDSQFIDLLKRMNLDQ